MSQNAIHGRTASEIAESIELAVESGKLNQHQRLPPIRQLARTIRVSPVTVAAAYRQLQTRGVLLSHGRRGTAVRASSAVPPLTSGRGERAGGNLIDLSTGNPDPALLPPLGVVLRAMDSSQALYGNPLELPALAAFAAAEFVADGLSPGPVAVTSGSLDAIERLLREHTRMGDRVAVEDPTFPALRDLIVSLGLVPAPFGVDDEGPRPEAFTAVLRAKVAAAILSPRAQNPTGAVISETRARVLSEIVRPHPAVVLIEIDDTAAVCSSPLRTLTTGRVHWALVRSTSKWLGPDLRLALTTGDAITIGRVRRRQSLSVRWVSHVLQRLAMSLWSDPANGRLLARAAQVYDERRKSLLDALAAHGIAAHGRSGFNVWIPVREETAIVKALGGRGWEVAAGELFRLHSPPAIRVTTSALTAENAQRFAADFAAAVRQRAVASG